MLSKRLYFGATVLNGKIYVAGGKNDDGKSAMNSVECYDPKTNKWQYLQSMNQPREEFGLVAVMGKLFAIGGKDRYARDAVELDTMEIYCPETNTWKFGASMFVSRSGHAVTAVSID